MYCRNKKQLAPKVKFCVKPGFREAQKQMQVLAWKLFFPVLFFFSSP
jgi:hypothetical protein